MANNDFIKLRNISKKFDDVIAVDSIDLDISEGEFSLSWAHLAVVKQLY